MRRTARTAHSGAAADDGRARPRLLSYAEFVDAALFDPRWGYYSAGTVRFGAGGHYDTYPLALSPFFGRMVAEYAYRLWRRRGAPGRFEICEVGAGNGQLCLDTLLWILERGRHQRAWKAFAAAARYRIVERSPALIARQRRQLGPLAESVRWTRGDAAQAPLRGTPFAPLGLIVANEVLDCLPHQKLVPQVGAPPAVVHVVAELGGQPLSPARLNTVLAGRGRRARLAFREVQTPLPPRSALGDFVRRHYPELWAGRRRTPAFFACPRIDALLRHSARFYPHGEALWIDYGAPRPFHLAATERRKVFAGPPRSRRGIYDDPGRDDITFMVDFSVVEQAARQAGWSVVFNGPQAELARRSGIVFDHDAVELIVRHRALGWMLALVGADPEYAWRRGAMSWSAERPATGHVPVRRYVQKSVREFLDAKRSPFRLMIARR